MSALKTIPKNFFEKTAWEKGLRLCGMDEVGRGCLAGPVVVASCILPCEANYPLLKDSKILTEAEREKAFGWISKHCFYSTSVISPHIIDKVNIYQATILGMHKAFMQLLEILPFESHLLKFLVVDAVPLVFDKNHLPKGIEIYSFPKGETYSTSIAAASIVAKVARDRLMGKVAKVMPQFKFENHKGYGTKAHLDELKSCGASILHRTSFLSNFNKGNSDDVKQQQALF